MITKEPELATADDGNVPNGTSYNGRADNGYMTNGVERNGIRANGSESQDAAPQAPDVGAIVAADVELPDGRKFDVEPR